MNVTVLKKVDRFLGQFLIYFFPRPTPIGQNAPRSVLFIRPGGIGDAILLLPAIRALKDTYPQVEIDVLAEYRNSQAFLFCPYIRRTFLYNNSSGLLSALLNRYDVVIDTEQWHRLSAIVARLIRSKMKIGFATNERKRLFNYPVPYDQDVYEAESFCRLLLPLGIAFPVEIERPFVEIDSRARERAGEMLGDLKGRSFVSLFPGASIPERRWGASKFRALAELLASSGIASVVLGGREDVSVCGEIVNGPTCLNLAGQTSLAESAAVIEKSDVLVSGDSGVLHIAVGLDVPTVSLFGPGITMKWAPRGGAHVVINHNLPCSPCTKFGYTPECPIGAKCIQEIMVEEVFSAVKSLLSNHACRK